jgi:hypothetical protein
MASCAFGLSILVGMDIGWLFRKRCSKCDVETFYVMDDSKDKEFTRLPYNYYPVASDNTAAASLRVEVRGFQWSHVLAEVSSFGISILSTFRF